MTSDGQATSDGEPSAPPAVAELGLDDAADLEAALLGGRPRYTRIEVAERAGTDVERAAQMWRALGFADVSDDAVVFTDRDVEALKTVQRLHELGLVDDDTQVTMTRAMGQSLSRVAEWQVGATTQALANDTGLGSGDPLDTVNELVPMMEGLLGYVWRRHLAATAGRLLAGSADEVAHPMAVGFADLVGFTTLTRHVDEDELSLVVERFERIAADVVAKQGGRVIKTVGDEVMFAADRPGDAAEIGLRLVEEVDATDELPGLRVGIGCGKVLARLGDLYGEPVNLAARLTSVARPSSVLVDRELAEALESDPRFRLRRVPPRPVRGYTLLHAARLRRADDAAGAQPTAD
ncbi:MAG: adenylate/guanylate cyclase domain-containing protein [Frankiales bacterium]|nr:adenylate/guanylate cyclase domain-containing protein [Frankiales bacterium]